MSEWYFDIELEDADRMSLKAYELDPQNLLFKWIYFRTLNTNNDENRKEIKDYAQQVLLSESPIKTLLYSKGALGKYVLELMTFWAKNELKKLIMQNPDQFE